MEEENIILEVDGKKIPMNEFVKKILSGMIAGSVGALRGVGDDWKTINIIMEK